MNSLKRLKGLGTRKHGDGRRSRDKASSPPPLVRLDELALASQEMQDMRDCYDSLLSAAAATTNSAYEFSESLREMGSCLLEKTALNDDEESGKVLLMLGKVQFELQKLVDSYRSHISQTITNPSESLLNELRTVEEMKRQCDEKREVYEYMIQRQKEKGRSRNGKGETFSKQQIQAAHEEYDEEATLFVFRMKSLKQGQSRSLLTQAARHHAAQLCFFKKALKSLEAVDPHVKWVTEQQHIEYHFSGLEDDCSDNSDDDDYEDDDYDTKNEEDEGDTHDDGELSFDYGQNDREHDVVSTSQNSMEVDQVDITFPQVATVAATKHNVDRGDRDPFSNKVLKLSISAPLFAEKNPDLAERAKEVQQRTPSRKFHTYVLPTPVDSKSSASPRSTSPVQTQPTSLSGRTSHLWHSSPLEPKKFEKDEKPSRPSVLNVQSVLKESNSPRIRPPFSEGLLFSHFDQHAAGDLKFHRQSFSGPISSKVGRNTPSSAENPNMFSGPLLRSPLPKSPSPPKASPTTSPTFVSSPKISELHELPRPPSSSTSKSPRGVIGHSAPLVSRAQEHSAANRSFVSNAASPLPKPPQALPRCFSIPSRDSRVRALNVSHPLEAPRRSGMVEDVSSPPLTPLTLPNVQSSTDPKTVGQATQNTGTD